MKMRLFCLISLALATSSGFAATEALTLPAGLSLIADHLSYPGGNTLNNILPNPPDGTVFYKWNCSGWTAYTYDAISAAWMPNGLATLNPGEGAMINLPVATTITFTGTPVTPVLPVTLPCGCNATNLLSRQTTNAPSTFQDVTGFAPTQGTSLTRINGGVTTVYTYSGGVWAPSTPTLNLGESALIYVPCVCCPDTSGGKYVQYPDVNSGIDVDATFSPQDPFDFLPWVLADDFPCTNSGPITDIHIWGSWLNNQVDSNAVYTLGIWSDAPTNSANPSYSHPNQLLWNQTYSSGQYALCPYTNKYENFYVGDSALYGYPNLLGSSTNLFYLCFDASPTNTFYQTGTPTAKTNYWLSVTVQSATGNRYFGWKSSATAYNDTAVAAFNGNFYPVPTDWYPMTGPQGIPLSLAFKITTASTSCVPPTVSGPSSLTNCVGTIATFTTIPSGTGPFSYQWRKNGTTISGATGSSYVLTVFSPTNAGTYCVIVTNSCGAVTNCAALTVRNPTALSGPTSTTNCVGTTNIFTAAASGSGPFTYQWAKNGAPIAGATSSRYSQVVTGPSDAGTYCVVVAGYCNSVTNCATLQLCSSNTVAQKWLQVPDTTPNGTDVRLYEWSMLADDFRCTASGPITEVRIWGSWLNDLVYTNPCFCLGLWTDMPTNSGVNYSQPGQLLCETCFYPGQYTNFLYTNVYYEQFWDPFNPIAGQIDSQVWEYVFTMPTNSCWWQTNGNTFWLSLRIPAGCFDTYQYQFGWKTCPTNWNDDAVYGYSPGSNWQDLHRPPNYTNSLDLAFQIITSPTNPPPVVTNAPGQKWLQVPDTTPNGIDVRVTDQTMLADDFRCTASGPITEVRIWGSWLNDLMYTNPCFCLGLWTDIPTNTASTYSQPGQLLCETCFYPGQYTNFLYANVYWEQFWDPFTTASGQQDSQVWEYVFTMPTNSCWWQTNGNTYWLSLRIPPGCFDPYQYQFGWKTCPTNWNDDAVYGYVPGYSWQDLHRPPYYTNSLDLAFQIITATNPCPPIALTCSSNITVTAASCSNSTATVFYTSTASGGCPPLNVTCNPPSGSSFPIGTTTVTCTATDGSGNSTNCSFTVTVNPYVCPPIALTCSTNITVTTASCSNTTATVFYSSSATGGCAPLSVVCNPPSGSTFLLGTTVVTCTATDGCGNSTNCSFTVTVNPHVCPPIALTCSTNITVTASGCSNTTATVFYSSSATGGCAPLNVVCTPLSGSTFPLGTTTVTCTASDGCGNSTICSFTVTVNPHVCPPIALTCSTNITVAVAGCSNSATVFYSSSATGGCPPLGLVCTPPSGSTFLLGTTVVTCTATDGCGNSTNCSFTVKVTPHVCPPIALTCSTNITVAAAGCSNSATVFYSSSATGGCPPLGLVCTPPSGSTFPLGTTTVTCTATDGCGNSTNCSFTVTVNPHVCPPIALTCSTNITVAAAGCSNSATVFYSSSATGGCAPLGLVCTPPSGSTFPLGTTTVTCTASDGCGNSTNCSFTVTVLGGTPPANDACTNAIPITVGSPAACGDTCCATPSPLGSIPNPCGLSISAPDVWYTYTPQCSGQVTVDTCGLCAGQTATFDTVLSAYSGPCGSFTQAACNDDAGGPCGLQSRITFNAQASVTYHIRVAGYQGQCGKFRLNLSATTNTPPNDLCANAIPVTAGSPAYCGTTICATPSAPGTIPPPCGASANAPDVWFTFTPICNGPITIDTCGLCTGQSSTFDTVLSAYTGSCNNLVQVACNDDAGGPCGLQSRITFTGTAGVTYHIRVAGYFLASGPFRLNITAPNLPPPNDNCANAIPVQIGSPAACGETCCATPSPAGSIPVPCGASLNARDVWYTWTPQCSGPATIDTCGLCPGQSTVFDTVLSVYSGPCGSFVTVACNDDGLGTCGLQSRVTFFAVAGVTYHIRVAGYDTTPCGPFRLNINQALVPPPNDLCANATPIGNGTYGFNTCGANTDGPTSNPSCLPNHDVWFRYTPPCAGQVWVDTCGSSFDTVLAVYTGPCGSLALVACNDNATSGRCSGSQQSFVSFNALANVTYYIRVGGAGAAQGWGVLTLNGPYPALGACPPANGPCYWRMFRVMGNANNTPWSWSIQVPCCANVGNTNVPGVPTGGDANALAQAFANSINNACPDGGIVAVALPIPGLPGLFVVCVKSCTNTPTPFVFRVGPVGALPQNQCVVANVGGPIWPPDPLPTTGPCSFNPDIIELPYAGHDYNNNGVDDAIDIMIGTSADLNGNGIPDEAESCQMPQVLTKPDSQVVTLGTNVTLSVTTSGTAPLNYQWSRNGLPLGAFVTHGALTISNVTAGDLGDYSITVSNACGNLTAGPFTLSVDSTEPVAPVITAAEFLKGNFQLTFSSKEGQTYVVEYKHHLDDPSWTPITTLVGDGQDQQVVDDHPFPQDMRFYRVRVTLP